MGDAARRRMERGGIPWRQALVGLMSLALASGGCMAYAKGRPLRGPFEGRVVDAETGQPIQGAVALAVWHEVRVTPVGGQERFYDAREAVTGADGRFVIPRAVPFYNLGVQRPRFYIFAPGYRREDTIVSPPEGVAFADPTVVRMRRLQTREDLLAASRTRPAGVPTEHMVEMTKAINRERASLGLDPLPVDAGKGSQP